MPLWKLDEPVHAGKIIKPHGYLGFVKVAFLFRGLEDVLQKNTYLFILHNKKPVPYLIEDIQWTDENSALIKFADIHSDTVASVLRDKDIVLPAALLTHVQEDEPEGAELIGYTVKDSEGNKLGNITGIIEGPQNLLEVLHKGSIYYIPLHPDLIVKVLKKSKAVIAVLPEGLMEL